MTPRLPSGCACVLMMRWHTLSILPCRVFMSACMAYSLHESRNPRGAELFRASECHARRRGTLHELEGRAGVYTHFLRVAGDVLVDLGVKRNSNSVHADHMESKPRVGRIDR